MMHVLPHSDEESPSREALSRVVATVVDGVTEEGEGWMDGAAKQDEPTTR